jgi:hypothetical protein
MGPANRPGPPGCFSPFDAFFLDFFPEAGAFNPFPVLEFNYQPVGTCTGEARVCITHPQTSSPVDL